MNVLRRAPLGEVCRFVGGGTPSRKQPEYFQGDIPWATVKDFKSYLISDTEEHISEAAVEDSSTNVVEAGTVLLVTRVGLGKVAIAGCRLAINQDIKAVIPAAGIEPYYLFWFLLSKSNAIQRMGTGATVKGVTLNDIKSIKIPVLPIHEQRRIVDLLSRADGIVRLRHEAEKKAAELIPALFFDMFGDPTTNPKRWDKQPITAVCRSSDDIKCGPFGTQLAKSEFRHEGVPLWGIKHVNAGFSIPTIEFLSVAKAVELDAYSILPGDIVMTRKGTIGNCALYPAGMISGVMHSDLLRIRPDPGKCEAQFLSDQLHTSRDVEYQIARTASSGAVMPGINVGRLKAVQILVPPIKIQREYAEIVGQITGIESQQSAATIKARSTFDALLAQIFS